MLLKIFGGNKLLFSGELAAAHAQTVVSYARGREGVTRVHDKVIQEVCDYFHVAPEDVRKECRIEEFIQPRAIIYYRLVTAEGYTRSNVARIFGRTHATVINGIKRARRDYRLAYKNIFNEDMI